MRFPSAISEAIATISTPNATGGIGTNTQSILLKVDSGASVSLAHPDHLSHIQDCAVHNLQPVRFSGIGGKTEVLRKVGLLTIHKNATESIAIKCYAFDVSIGETTKLDLLSSWAIDHYKIEQRHHTYTSLRIGP